MNISDWMDSIDKYDLAIDMKGCKIFCLGELLDYEEDKAFFHFICTLAKNNSKQVNYTKLFLFYSKEFETEPAYQEIVKNIVSSYGLRLHKLIGDIADKVSKNIEKELNKLEKEMAKNPKKNLNKAYNATFRKFNECTKILVGYTEPFEYSYMMNFEKIAWINQKNSSPLINDKKTKTKPKTIDNEVIGSVKINADNNAVYFFKNSSTNKPIEIKFSDKAQFEVFNAIYNGVCNKSILREIVKENKTKKPKNLKNALHTTIKNIKNSFKEQTQSDFEIIPSLKPPISEYKINANVKILKKSD